MWKDDVYNPRNRLLSIRFLSLSLSLSFPATTDYTDNRLLQRYPLKGLIGKGQIFCCSQSQLLNVAWL